MKIRLIHLMSWCLVMVLLAAKPALGEFTLVEGGRGRAVIVTPEKPAATTSGAAQEFQAIVKQMTGAELPIVAETAYDGATPPVLIGPSKLAVDRGVAVEQSYEDGDRYVVRADGRTVALVGNDDGGLLGSSYAAFDLLQRLGCGWFGPDPVWHVIPKTDTLRVPSLNVDTRPDFQMRIIWMVKDPQMRRAWRLGGIDVPANHNLSHLVPETLKPQHPDWFGKGQPCLTHPEVRKHVAGVLRKEIDASKLPVTRLSIATNDNDEFCQCDRCKAAGNVSARMVAFADALARDLRTTHEGRFGLVFLAYWMTHGPPEPMTKGPPELTVMIVNEGDHAHPLDAPVPPEHAKRGRSNLREQRALDGWRETGSLRAVYEWWIPGCSVADWRSVPWYSGETALRNLRYWRERGIKYLTYETQYENGDGFPIRWPLYYMAARGAWDSSVKAEDVMREACAKLYGDAAAPMARFYRTLELAMLNTGEAGGNWSLPSPELIYSAQAEDEATASLDEAGRATKDPAALTRIAAERRMWTQARQVLAKLRAEKSGQAVFAVRLDDRTVQWQKPAIDERALRDLFDLKPDAALQAVEADGQSRSVQPGETFDLRNKVTFRVAK